MRKLNRKGFTLIELLAVIVILAIVMVVTIPSVLNAMDNARESQLKNGADAVSEWLTKQRELDELGGISGGASTDYTGIASALNASTITSTNQYTLTDTILKAAGFTGGTADATGTAYYNSSAKRYCVVLTAVSSGKFKSVTNPQQSAGC